MQRILLLSTVLLLSTGCRCCCESCAPEDGGGTAIEDSTPESDASETLEWSGNHSGIHEARREVIRSADEWSALWTRHAGERLPSRPVPQVDWTKQMVVAIALGDCPTAGYSVGINGSEQDGGKLVVHVRKSVPAPDSMQAQVVTSPFVFRTVSRFDGEVVFREE